MFNLFKKDDVHTLRNKAVDLLAGKTYAVQKEIIESLIMVYLPECHLHRSPKKKRITQTDVKKQFDDQFNVMEAVDNLIGNLKSEHDKTLIDRGIADPFPLVSWPSPITGITIPLQGEHKTS